MNGGVIPAAAPRPRPLRRWGMALLGVAISVGLLVWALQGVALAEIAGHIRHAHVAPLAAAVAIATSTFLIRLIRWRLLLRRDDGGPVGWGPLWHAVAIGFMANNTLPFRAGEFLRSYAASRLGGVRFTAAFSSVAVERVFDGIAVIALLVIGLAAAGLPSGLTVAGVSVAGAATTAAVICGLALAGAAAVVAFPIPAERIVRRLVPAPALAERIVGAIEGIRHGLQVLRSPSRIAAVAGWSAALWLINAASFWVAFAAFELPVGFAGALLLQGLLVIGISVPSTPGFVGPFEAVIVAVLALYSIGNDLAFSYAITYHAATFVPIVLLGVWSLARTPIALSDARKAAA